MKTLLKIVLRAFTRVAASEAGEGLSVRGKTHRLQAYFHQSANPRSPTKTATLVR